MDGTTAFIFSVLVILLAGLSATTGAAWARRRTALLLDTQTQQARRDREESLARYELQMKMEVAALEGRINEDRKRLTREFAAIESRRQAEIARWRRIALTPSATLTTTDYPDRPSPRDLDALCSRLRGFAFLDALAIANEDGLLLAGEESPAARNLAALAPHAESTRAALCGSGDRAVIVSLLTEDARYVTFRPLPAWTGRSWLFALSVGQQPSTLAIDAVVSMAALREDQTHPSSSDHTPGKRESRGVYAEQGGFGRAVAGELETFLNLTGGRGLAVFWSGQLAAAIIDAGPDLTECQRVGEALEKLRVGAAWYLRTSDLLRIDVTLEDGLVLTYAPLDIDSPAAVLAISQGHPPSQAQILAVLGRLRAVSAPPPPEAWLAFGKLNLPQEPRTWH